MSDPKAKFKKYVGAESGGGRPKGKGFITELQRQKLKPAHLDVIVEKNKERNHLVSTLLAKPPRTTRFRKSATSHTRST